MNRRTLLKRSGLVAGALGAAAVGGRYFLLPPSRRWRDASARDVAAELFVSLDARQRASMCVPYDHPLRQYHNRGLWTGGTRIFGNFSWTQRQLLVDLFYAGISKVGASRVAEQHFLRWPGVHLLNALICGDPTAGPYLVLLTGPHLNLRVGGRCDETTAFGGPQIYGDQRGDMKPGLPGNRYRYQLERATRVFESMSNAALEAATFAREPSQTQIGLRGSSANPPGVPLGETSPRTVELARELLRAVLENYPVEDAEYAQSCVDANGGVGALRVSYYQQGEAGPAGRFQIFRLEGPAAVFYFRGHPHLHAFINVGMDGDAPLSVGALLGENPTLCEGPAVAALFEEVLGAQAGAEVAFYPDESVAGRLRAGPVRTGDIYNLESWNDQIVTVDVEGDLQPPLVARLQAAGIEPDPGRTFTVATTAYAANELAAQALGRVRERRRGPMLRDASITHLRARGFGRTG